MWAITMACSLQPFYGHPDPEFEGIIYLPTRRDVIKLTKKKWFVHYWKVNLKWVVVVSYFLAEMTWPCERFGLYRISHFLNDIRSHSRSSCYSFFRSASTASVVPQKLILPSLKHSWSFWVGFTTGTVSDDADTFHNEASMKTSGTKLTQLWCLRLS